MKKFNGFLILVFAVVFLLASSIISVEVIEALPTSNVLAGGICINEILIDPDSAGMNYDTDGNGAPDELDEFVELYNLSSAPIDISGFQLWDLGRKKWFTFPSTPPTILGPGKYAIVIDGVQDGGSLPSLSAGNLAFDAGRSGATINNGGDNVVLYDPNLDQYIQLLFNGDEQDDPITYTGFSATATRVGEIEDFGSYNAGESIVRDPAGDQNVVLHTKATGFSKNASPGEATVPVAAEVTATADDGTYYTGDVIVITVIFSEAVNVTGTPLLTLETGAPNAVVNYASGSGTATLTFDYTVSEGDASADLDYVSVNALDLNGGTIKNLADTKNAILTLPASGATHSLGANKEIAIDTTAPTVVTPPSSTPSVAPSSTPSVAPSATPSVAPSATPSVVVPSSAPSVASIIYLTSTATAGSYTAGSVIEIIVRFSKTVWVKGMPQLMLDTGQATPGTAYYSAGSSTETLAFIYTVASGDMISDLDCWSEWALELNDGQIYGDLGIDADLVLPVPGDPDSLGYNVALSLDTVYPVHRFYRPGLLKYFFTIDENEKEHLINNAANVWQYEGPAYNAFLPKQYRAATRLQRNTLIAVHRFYSEVLQTHLFTTDKNEKEYLIVEAADIWRYEGPAFYIPSDYQEGALPVYRFYSDNLIVHLLTTDENEKNFLINTAGDVWRYEGIAFHAYP
ncbi:lamin tail domain-containing protein [Desulfococcaceae bacterium HSG9]|nr:lamin tail domain-containing protein [Desulfococcaceae bacterium HSG9]